MSLEHQLGPVSGHVPEARKYQLWQLGPRVILDFR
jgi:hypothetical protein